MITLNVNTEPLNLEHEEVGKMGKILTPTGNDFGKTDAVVIGGGIVGTATAFWLSRAGLDVVVVEMRDGLST